MTKRASLKLRPGTSARRITPFPITGREIADSFKDAIWYAETQMFNGHGVAKYLLSRAVRAAGIKVVFTGEGADEMLGGYPYFRVDALNDNAALSAGEKSALLDEMLGANAATRALLMPEQVDSPEMQAVERRLGWLPASLNMGAAQINSVAPLFRDDLPVSVREFQPLVSALDRLPLAQRVAGRDRLNQMLYVNAKTVLPNFILNYLADRMEMAHSIEGRVPFLDHHVAEVAARVPVNMKVKGIREKHVLREAAKDVLIPEVYDRQKHPFTTPPTRNKNDPMLTFYRDTFASQAAKDQPIYDMKKVSTPLDQLLECPDDQRIAVEGGLQRVASVVVMQETVFDDVSRGGWARTASAMQGGPVGELLDVAVERPALDQLEVEVGRTLEDRVITGLTGDHREERHLDAVDQAGGHQCPIHRQAAV